MNKNEPKCVLCGAVKDEKSIGEYAKESFITAYMIKTLSQPFTEMLAYKNGIIDQNGNQLKRPVTIDEKNSLTALDSYIIKLKKLLGNKIDLVNHTMFLEATTKTPKNLTQEEYSAELAIGNELKFVKARFDECIKMAQELNVPSTTLEKLILESIVKF
jgi:hypothetical protein